VRSDWSEADIAQLDERGISVNEVERQLALFRRPANFARLVRPCTIGDGIRRIEEDEIDELTALHAEAAAAGRFTKFVPASGAATRMFRELLRYQKGPDRGLAWGEVVERAERGDAAASAVVRFLQELTHFAFFDELDERLTARGTDAISAARAGELEPILDALLDDRGMGYENLPKGLLGFHRSDIGPRTPFEEHLVEAAGYTRAADGACRLHFTVSPEHRDRFDALFASVRETYESGHDVYLEIEYSAQKPSTDTVAVDLRDRPLRDEAGRLIFRPGGHGALIENLNDLQADLVYVKNIDNVQPDDRKAVVIQWKKILGGYLVKLERQSQAILNRLRRETPAASFLERALRFAGTRLQIALNGRFDTKSPEARRGWLIDRLSRPLRICGVVPNTGEPGGGPFWVRDADETISPQIVETAQIDLDDADQREILKGATHFNPVDLVCAVRDGRGRPYDLSNFVDPNAVIVTRKSLGGRDLKALERPGLWNGAMAAWNTVFVEVPLETFSPAKTILDLLRREHQ
jgi:hypothetical protein